MKETWYYAKNRLPKPNTYIEFVGDEYDDGTTKKLKFIFKVNKKLQVNVIHIKQHSNKKDIDTTKFYNLLHEDLFVGDRWRYLNNNEMMAYL